MAKILCLETATTNCSIGLGVNGEVKSLVEEDSQQYSHSEQLHVFITEALTSASLSLNDLDAVAVSRGPGSYTGLRIGVSAAKGLCFSLDIPLISISTLKSMATQIPLNRDEAVISLLDARRMEVYAGAYNYEYSAIAETKAEIISEVSFQEYLATYQKIHIIGNGAEKCIDVLGDGSFLFRPGIVPSAREMIALGQEKFKQGDFEDIAYFEPFYLKDFILQGKKKN